jgi:(p)ppGpp synthase/HD superfamily hydrolase
MSTSSTGSNTEPIHPLAKAIRIASTVHEAQQDKAGAPYILHPLRMMQRAHTGDEQIVAMLHDVIEDSREQDAPVTFEKLREEGFSETIVDAVGHLTNRKPDGESYKAFIERVVGATGKSGDIARRVKLLDLEDNMNLSRLAELDDKMIERLKRYQKAHKAISAKLTNAS